MSGKRHTGVANSNARDQYAATGQVQDRDFVFAVDSGAVNALVITPAPSIPAYKAGQEFVIIPAFRNTGAATLNVSGVGAVAIQNRALQPLIDGDINVNTPFIARSNGAVFIHDTAPIRVLAFMSVGQSIPNAVPTILDFNSEEYDSGLLHDIVTNNSRITIPAGFTRAIFTGRVNYGSGAVGNRSLELVKGGSTAYAGRTGVRHRAADTAQAQEVMIQSPLLTVTGTDFFELRVRQEQGVAISTVSGNGGTWFYAEIW